MNLNLSGILIGLTFLWCGQQWYEVLIVVLKQHLTNNKINTTTEYNAKVLETDTQLPKIHVDEARNAYAMRNKCF